NELPIPISQAALELNADAAGSRVQRHQPTHGAHSLDNATGTVAADDDLARSNGSVVTMRMPLDDRSRTVVAMLGPAGVCRHSAQTNSRGFRRAERRRFDSGMIFVDFSP